MHNFVASLLLQYALFFSLGLNLRRSKLTFIPQSVASHRNMLLLTRSGHLCNILVRKLLGNKPYGSNWIFSRLHHLDVLPPTLVMDFWMYDQANEVRLSIPRQLLPPFLVSVNFDRTILVKIEQGSQPNILQSEKKTKYPPIISVSFPENGSLIVMNGGDNPNDATLLCVSGEEMKHVADLRGHGDELSSYSVHNQFPILATSSFKGDPTIRIWKVSDLSDVNCVAIFEGHDASVFSVDFHPNLPILVSCGQDCQTILWHFSPETFSLISKVVLPKQDTWVLHAVFHSNLPILATALENGKIILWTLSSDFTSVRYSETIQHGTYARSLEFHPFLPILVTSGRDSDASVKFWHISTSFPAVCFTKLPFAFDFACAHCMKFHPELPIMVFFESGQSLIVGK
jgi:WD40 repeat protein